MNKIIPIAAAIIIIIIIAAITITEFTEEDPRTNLDTKKQEREKFQPLSTIKIVNVEAFEKCRNFINSITTVETIPICKFLNGTSYQLYSISKDIIPNQIWD